jgi:hypothetical protein
MEKLTPEDLREIFLTLQTAELEAVVVGGQAVNLWAYQYSLTNPQLQAYLPFASEDLDFYGGRVEAMLCKEILGGEVTLNQDFDPSPNAGVVIVNRDDRVLRIDFLASVFGLNDSEITGTAVPFIGQERLAGVGIKVLHPILCLEGKLRCLRGLPQGGRQDLKHVQMSLLCMREMLKHLCSLEDNRPGLKMTERVMNSGLREDGLNVWHHHQVNIESAVPIQLLSELSNEKWKRFCEIRWPQYLEQLNAKRSHYQAIMTQISDRKLQVTGNQTMLGAFEILERLGEVRPDSSRIFEGKHWCLLLQDDVLTITNKTDGREILCAEGKRIIAFNPLPEDQPKLELLHKVIKSVEQPDEKQQQRPVI